MARDFSGTAQYLRATVAPITAVPLTLFGWYRYDTAISEGAEHTVLSLTDADAFNEFTIEIGRDSGVDYAIAMVNQNNSSLGFALSSGPPTINTWQALAGEYSTTSRRDVFLNGSNVGNDTTSATPTGISDIMAGGVSSNSSIIKLFNGSLAELAAWNRVLTAAEHTKLAAGFSPLFIPDGLIFYVPVLGQDSPEPDFKSSNSMVVTGATKIAHPDFIRYPSGIYKKFRSGNGISFADRIL